MNKLVAFAQALADPTRWRILQLLSPHALCVCELADILGMPTSSVSSQIQVIKKAGLLEQEKCGKWIYYRVSHIHQNLLSSVAAHCHASVADNKQLQADQQMAATRLELREQSCCPRPQRLKNLS